jgi:hypothetical protein
MRVSVCLLCALVLGVASQVSAAPLNSKQVSADAKAVVHVDADALRVSVVVEKGYQICEEKAKQFGGQVEELKVLFTAVDPTQDVKGLTFYTTQLKQPGGVVILNAKFNESAISALNEQVQKLPGYAVTSYNSNQLHSWSRGNGQTVVAAYVQPDLMVFGSTADEVKAALDVLAGTKPNIVGKSPLAAEVPAGALVLARVADLPKEGLPVDSPIIKQSDVLGVIIGENNNEAYLTCEAFAKDVKTADTLKTAVEDVLTKALLATEDADLANLINAVQVTTNDKEVVIDVRGPADMGWMYLEKLVGEVVKASKKVVEAKK